MLKEMLPLDKGISFSGTRDRIHILGKQLDADIERDIAKLPQTVADVKVRESSHAASVSDAERGLGRHVNIVAARATLTDGYPKVVCLCAQGSPLGRSVTRSVPQPKCGGER